MQFANLAGFENELRAQFCIDFGCVLFWAFCILLIQTFKVRFLLSPISISVHGQFHFGICSVFEAPYKICGGLLLKLSGFAPVMPRLNNVGLRRTKDRYSDEYGKLRRPKRWKSMWAGAQQLEEHMEPQSLPFCIGKCFNSLMCRMRIGEATCIFLPKSCCGKPVWFFGLVAWPLILRSYMILLVSPLRGLEIHPKGSDHPSWIGINLGDFQNAYRMSRGE